MIPPFLQGQIHQHFLIVILICQIPVRKVLFLTPWVSLHRNCIYRRISNRIWISWIPNNEKLSFLKLETKSHRVSFPIILSLCPKSTPQSLNSLNIISIKCNSCRKCSEESLSMVKCVVNGDNNIISHSVIAMFFRNRYFFSFKHPSVAHHIRNSSYYILSCVIACSKSVSISISQLASTVCCSICC